MKPPLSFHTREDFLVGSNLVLYSNDFCTHLLHIVLLSVLDDQHSVSYYLANKFGEYRFHHSFSVNPLIRWGRASYDHRDAIIILSCFSIRSTINDDQLSMECQPDIVDVTMPVSAQPGCMICPITRLTLWFYSWCFNGCIRQNKCNR